MKREELEHVLRASAAITTDRRYYVGEITVVSPDLHDVAVSKCVAGRDKDADWVRALLRHRMIDAARLETRLRALDTATMPVEKFIAWARRRAQEAST